MCPLKKLQKQGIAPWWCKTLGFPKHAHALNTHNHWHLDTFTHLHLTQTHCPICILRVIHIVIEVKTSYHGHFHIQLWILRRYKNGLSICIQYLIDFTPPHTHTHTTWNCICFVLLQCLELGNTSETIMYKHYCGVLCYSIVAAVYMQPPE